MFFFGEDSVTDNLSPYIDAAPKEEQKYFLATQQVDEARHAVFFHRFFSEVIGAGDDIASTLAFTEQHLGWGYTPGLQPPRQDGATSSAAIARCRSSRRRSRSTTWSSRRPWPSRASTSSRTSSSARGRCPASAPAWSNVSRDEQRHIGFGVKVLSELLRESDECKAAVDELLREVMPWLSSVFIPPNWDRRVHALLRLRARGDRRLGLQGGRDEVEGDRLPDAGDASRRHARWTWRWMPTSARGATIIRMSQAGVIGEPGQDPDSSPEIQALYFESVGRSVDTRTRSTATGRSRSSGASATPRRGTSSSTTATRAVAGEAPSADVTLESSWRDWVALSTQGGDPRRAMLRRKLRPRGSLRALWRMQRVFPRSGG